MKFEQNISEQIFRQKYMLHNEDSIEDVFKKVAEEIANIEKNKNEWSEKFYNIMSDGSFIPGGRILANARIDSKMKNYNNCFVIGIEDSMEGIFDSLKEDALISKMGGGVGFNISKLRPKEALLSKGGESSGPISFLRIFDASGKTIQTGGYRRSAKICILNVDHPDIEEFITCKQGDKNNTLTGFNLSVGITDKFVKAVEDDKDWDLKFNNKIYKTVKAKDLYNLITKNAYLYNEPGIINLDTVNKFSNAYYLYDIQSTNPCITGDTLVAVADGRNAVPIKILAEEGKDVPVYSKDKNGKTVIKMFRNIRLTRKNTSLVKVVLDDHSEIKCTPDHLFMMRNGEYKSAENLKKGDSLKPFNSYISNSRYRQIQSGTSRDRRQYRMITEFNNIIVDPKTTAIHHIDFNSSNDSIENLYVMTHDNHKVLSISYINNDDVYDGIVDETHNFAIITSYKDDKHIESSGIYIHNCGEINLPEYGVCCLGAINLSNFVENPFTEDAHIQEEKLYDAIKIAVRFLDNTLDTSEYPLDKIKERALNDRRIGLGITGLGSMLAEMRLEYGSKESIHFIDNLMENFRDVAYTSSVEIAKEKGVFPLYDKEKFLNSNFIKNIKNQELIKNIEAYGIRNVALLTIAPTGTTSLSVGQNCSSGIEPVFALQYDRNIRQKNDEQIKETVFDRSLLKYKKQYPEIEEIPFYFKTALEIAPEEAIEVQSTCQKYIDNSISKTLNIPENYSQEDYNKLFMLAHKKKLKGFTSFRIGSMKGVLETVAQENEETRPEAIKRTYAPKRPEILQCDIHEITINKERHIILVGKIQGTLYEIFVTNDPENKIDKIQHKTGWIKKIKKGQYSLIVENGSEKVVIDNIKESFDSIYGSLSRFISMGLRHGVPLQFIVDQLNKDTNFAGFEKSVARILKKYIKEGEKVLADKCSNCGSDMVFQEGCVICPSCGWSKCG